MSQTSDVVWPPGQHYNTFINRIRAQGYSWGDEGAFAEVYINEETKRVVKIGEKWDAYFVFAKAVYALNKHHGNSLNPYLPRIYNLTIRSSWYMVEMELLRPLWNRQEAKEEAKGLIDALERIVGYGRCPRDIAAYIIQFPSQVWELAAIISLTLNDCSRSPRLDLHSCNVMLRDHQLVVTDPIASR
jgi:hypothetical protein